MFNEHGHEFFAVLPKRCEGRAWRHERAQALEKVVDAVKQRGEPGEVVL